MTVPEILETIDRYTGNFPAAAMRAAIAQREAVTPELLRILEEVAADPVKFAGQKDRMQPVLGLYLLAQFRDKRAYPLMARIFSAPGETSSDLVGDTIAEGLDRLFASVYDGDPGPLQALIENDAADEFVRSSAIGALVILERTGQASREWVVGYLRELFQGKLTRDGNYAWDGLIDATAKLPAPELLDEVRRAFADGLSEGGPADLKFVEDAMKRAAQRLSEADFNDDPDRGLIEDAIAETRWWACFDPRESDNRSSGQIDVSQREQSWERGSPPAPVPFQQAVRTKVGRNEPCPCGSGKKYKKCCGA